MESKRIEDKLKEYRERKEKERLARIRASKPFYERALPSFLITPASKIVGAIHRNRTTTSIGNVEDNGNVVEKTEHNELPPDSVSSDEITCEAPVKPASLRHRAKKSTVKLQVCHYLLQ